MKKATIVNIVLRRKENKQKSHIIPPFAGIAQLVERNLAKVEVASSRLVSRSSLDRTAFRYEMLFYRKKGLFIKPFFVLVTFRFHHIASHTARLGSIDYAFDYIAQPFGNMLVFKI